ncbi:MAG TPA: hypothetical protein VKB38_08260 [Terracidiphilus sp.]|nr:hypothetical protein [Terracidiphilus sp.]
MIRQAISCDICAAEKKQTNHWFVACEQNGELRVSGWSSRGRLKAGTKHLCGQTCLHKLVDEFMARTIASRSASGVAEAVASETPHNEIDASLTSSAAFDEFESSARLIPAPAPPEPAAQRPVSRPVPAACTTVVAMPARVPAELEPVASLAPHEGSSPNYTSRRWRAEAWERERNREMRSADHRSEIPRRRNGF